MPSAAEISPTIVDSLYTDAIELADEARLMFELMGKLYAGASHGEEARSALSCEALRTTTRMMHAIAWLLNHRAYLAGELSEYQLRNHGRLPEPQPDGEPEQMALLDEDLLDLVDRTRQFYDRAARLDRTWQRRFDRHPTAVHQLHQRLNGMVRSL